MWYALVVSSSASPVPRGTLLAGKYRMSDPLGEGANGIVVQALHETLRQKVAIKILKGDPDAVRRARMLREARIAATLQSDHSVRVADVLTLDDGSPCIVMEYLEGCSLSEKLEDDGPLPLELGVLLMRQACEALSEAHAAGLVHRDLKPGNLFLTQKRSGLPRLKVLDYGLAKAVSRTGPGDETISHSQVAIGTPAYMSPEQVRSSKDVDARSDIWALGVVLRQLVTGRLPFAGENSAAILAAIAADSPRPLREDLEDAPPRLQRIIDRCLRKLPTERFSTVDELDEELAALQAELGLSEPRARVQAPPNDVVEQDTAQSMATAHRTASNATIQAARVGWYAVAVLAIAGAAYWQLDALHEKAAQPSPDDTGPAMAEQVMLERITATSVASLSATANIERDAHSEATVPSVVPRPSTPSEPPVATSTVVVPTTSARPAERVRSQARSQKPPAADLLDSQW